MWRQKSTVRQEGEIAGQGEGTKTPNRKCKGAGKCGSPAWFQAPVPSQAFSMSTQQTEKAKRKEQEAPHDTYKSLGEPGFRNRSQPAM